MTQTINQWGPMPRSIDELSSLAPHLEEIRKENVDHHLRLAEIAAKDGVQVICFGELFPFPYFAFTHEDMWLDAAETIQGQTVQECAAAARTLGLVIVAPIYEKDESSGRYFNTAVFIDADGEVLGHYSKAHIPHGENESNAFLERHYYEGSIGRLNEHEKNVSKHPYFPVFETKVGRVGAAICYDRHFEGVLSTLAHEGAELVFSPAATFGKKSQRLWYTEFAVEAARHNLFVGGSNRFGSERPWNQPFYGGTHFVGPNGRHDNQSPHPELVVANLPLHELHEPDPAGWKLRAHHRRDIFARVDDPDA
jgi:N-carbamoylputrescine amidase